MNRNLGVRLVLAASLSCCIVVQGCDSGHDSEKTAKAPSDDQSARKNAGGDNNGGSAAKEPSAAKRKEVPAVVQPDTKENTKPAQEPVRKPTEKPSGGWPVPHVTLSEELSGEKLTRKRFQKKADIEQYTRNMRIGDLKATLGVSPKDLKAAPCSSPLDRAYIVIADGWVVVVTIIPKHDRPVPDGAITDPETRVSVSVSKKAPPRPK